jgi:N6-adenosine-specific RNA methylase IME4
VKYRTIVADPPWNVSGGPLGDGMGEGFTGGGGKSKPLPYPTMTVAEISALPVAERADRNCALYLWTTNGYLHAAFHVVAAWGFTYSTTIVWAKALMGSGLGGCWGISTEYVLYARRGSPLERSHIGGTWHEWKRPYMNGHPDHSAKPPNLLDAVERIHDGPRLELFARRQRLGWDTWGDECFEHVSLTEGGAA